MKPEHRPYPQPQRSSPVCVAGIALAGIFIFSAAFTLLGVIGWVLNGFGMGGH